MHSVRILIYENNLSGLLEKLSYVNWDVTFLGEVSTQCEAFIELLNAHIFSKRVLAGKKYHGSSFLINKNCAGKVEEL